MPSHWSKVQVLVSAVQAVPARMTASAGQVVQWLPSAVQADPAALTASAGQVVLAPVQVSARSHSLTVARHTVPAWPAGCVQRGLPTVPLQVSVVQGLPSSVQADPADLTVLAGLVLVHPVQASRRQPSLTVARHTVPA